MWLAGGGEGSPGPARGTRKPHGVGSFPEGDEADSYVEEEGYEL